MYNTIENTHNRVLDKISITREAIAGLATQANSVRAILTGLRKQLPNEIDQLRLNIISADLDAIETSYLLAITHVLGDYYSHKNTNTAPDYYRILSAENTIGRVNNLILLTRAASAKLMVCARACPVRDRDITDDAVEMINADLECAAAIDASEYIIKRNVEICKCGEKMRLIPDVSELRCDLCLRTKKVLGSVLHYDQTYDAKSKTCEYDVVRHLRFHLEHLQALEAKTFDNSTLERISYVMNRDGIIKTVLTCEIMRNILKDPYVNATHLNNHAPLLVKTFGGRAPPTFDYDEIKILKTRFIRTTNVHADLNPFGGNTPYYPHFIHKIAEVQFKDNPEKLRILDYIHLQSAETVEKNDRYFEDVCNAVNDPSSGLIYTPTDTSGRF